MPRPLLALAASLVLFALPACRETTAPAVAAGTFVLRDIASAAPPVTFYTAVDGTYSVLGDTIELDGAGTAYRTFLVRRTASIYGADTVYGARRAEEYRVNGTGIEIGSFRPCPINANCAPNDTGRLLGPVMTLGSSRTGRWQRWSYERIAPMPR